MKGSFKVSELNDSGIYVSDIDWDDCYKEKGNPRGNFVMIIEPLSGFDKGVIYYKKVEDGFIIEGEAYILTGRKNILEKKVSKWVSEYVKKDFEYVEDK